MPKGDRRTARQILPSEAKSSAIRGTGSKSPSATACSIATYGLPPRGACPLHWHQNTLQQRPTRLAGPATQHAMKTAVASPVGERARRKVPADGALVTKGAAKLVAGRQVLPVRNASC